MFPWRFSVIFCIHREKHDTNYRFVAGVIRGFTTEVTVYTVEGLDCLISSSLWSPCSPCSPWWILGKRTRFKWGPYKSSNFDGRIPNNRWTSGGFFAWLLRGQ